MSTLFEKIIQREIPSEIVYEDDLCLAFKDISPKAPIHLLVIPKKPIPRISQGKEEDKPLFGHLLFIAGQMGEKWGKEKGFRLVINSGSNGGETVPHLHIHVLAGRSMHWPPG